jgi:hypothetical protein
MPNVITAGNSSNGGTAISTDTSGTLNIVTGSGSGATAVTVDGSQNLSFNSGYGSAAVAYGCRAWVNFNGTGTVAIRASGNVTSITDNGTGAYTVNFTTAMPDVNYAASLAVVPDVLFSSGNAATRSFFVNTVATTNIQVATGYQTTASGSAGLDYASIYVSIFR